MKKVKAWAVVSPSDIYFHEARPMIYSRKKEAVFNRYVGAKVVSCVISYELPNK